MPKQLECVSPGQKGYGRYCLHFEDGKCTHDNRVDVDDFCHSWDAIDVFSERPARSAAFREGMTKGRAQAFAEVEKAVEAEVNRLIKTKDTTLASIPQIMAESEAHECLKIVRDLAAKEGK